MILAGKTSRKIMITKRIAELKNVIQVNTQRLRSEALDRLKQLFNLASEIALGELKTINLQKGKPVKVTLKQRQMWARIAVPLPNLYYVSFRQSFTFKAFKLSGFNIIYEFDLECEL